MSNLPVWKDIKPSAQAVFDAYAARDYRPTVLALLRDASGLELLVKAARNAEWGVVQGGISEGEAPRVALARELREEIGARASDVAPATFIGCADIDAPEGSAAHLLFTAGVRYYVFDVPYRGLSRLILQEEELSDYVWVPPTHIPGRLSAGRAEKRELILASYRLAGRLP